jgi:4-amino-4-deoxy-L-arabinose transferase-like glycosyltransferase
MTSSPARPGSRTAASLAPIAVITLMAAALRLPQMAQSIYGDEMWSYVAATQHGLGGVLDFVRSDQEITPPLYPVLAWLSAKLGDPATLVRLPTVVAGIATIPLIYAIAIRTLGRRVALVASLLAALSPFMAFYAVEARAYAVMMAMVAASTLCMLIAVERRTIPWWAAYGVASCAAMYSHYTAAYVLAAQLGWLLWFHRDCWRPALAANALAALAFLPWLPGLREDLHSPTVGILDALAPLDPHSLIGYSGSWALGHPAQGLHTFWGTGLELALFAGIALGAVGLVLRLRERTPCAPPGGRGSLCLVVLLALATPVAILVVSLVGDDMYIPRNLAASWPAWSIALAALLTAGPPAIRIASISVVVAVFAVGAVRTDTDPWQRPDIKAAARFIDSQTGPEDPVLDASSGFSDPQSPLTRTLPIQLGEPHDVINVAAGGDVERGIEEAAGHRLTVFAPHPYIDLIARSPGLKGLQPIAEQTFPGLLQITALVYEIPAQR